MAAISLLGFNLPDGLILSNSTVNGNMTSNTKSEAANVSKTFSKITVQNVLSENNGNSINISNNNSTNNGNGNQSSTVNMNGCNAIVRKIKDFGMVGAVNNAPGGNSKAFNSRKRPLMDSKKNVSPNESNQLKPTTPTVPKKLKQTKESTTTPKTAKKSTISTTTTNENVQQCPSKKIAANMKLNGALNPKPAGTPGRKGLPLPQAVARRNARERNRVKQVNNGFAALRERIPEEVAEAFESHSQVAGGRNQNVKKLSKVETLRMAVEYIRSLERLLGFDFTMAADVGHRQQNANSSGEDSYTLIKDEFDTLSPSLDENFDDSLSHYDMDDYFSTANNNEFQQQSQADMPSPPATDLLPDITTLNGLQYIRIPGTNTYQLLTPDIFVGSTQSPPNSSIDDDQFNALIDANCMSPTIGLKTSTINANNSASPPTASSPAAALIATAQSAAALSARLSPVPTQMQPSLSSSSSSTPPSTSSSSTSSPDAAAGSTLTLSPATNNSNNNNISTLINERTSQSSCATTSTTSTSTIAQLQRQFIAPSLPHLLPHFIKEEFVGDQLVDDFVSTRKSASGIFFQTTTTGAGTAGNQHATLSLSPPLDRCSNNRLLIAPHHHQQQQPQQHHLATSAIELQSFYEQDDSGSFYENNLSFKKEFNDVLLDASTATTTALSDESMIEAIDWWEAHTPQSEAGGGGGGGGAGGCGGSFALS